MDLKGRLPATWRHRQSCQQLPPWNSGHGYRHRYMLHVQLSLEDTCRALAHLQDARLWGHRTRAPYLKGVIRMGEEALHQVVTCDCRLTQNVTEVQWLNHTRVAHYRYTAHLQTNRPIINWKSHLPDQSIKNMWSRAGGAAEVVEHLLASMKP